ncbi:hypothetical protein [Desulfoplanes sp.]
MHTKHIEIKPMTWVAPEFSVASKCDLDILAGPDSTLVVVSEREDNRDAGLPITEGPGIIAMTLYRWYGYEPESMIWIEHVPVEGAYARVELVCEAHRVTDWQRTSCSPAEIGAIRAEFQG